jgi:hypothetical protein
VKIESEMGLVGGVSDGGAVRMVSGDQRWGCVSDEMRGVIDFIVWVILNF